MFELPLRALGTGTKDRPTKQFEREDQRLKYESAQAELAAAAAGKHDLAC